MDADTTRAWGEHFAALAADYEVQAKRSMLLARTKPLSQRRRWITEARALVRIARRCARNAAERGVTRPRWPTTYTPTARPGAED